MIDPAKGLLARLQAYLETLDKDQRLHTTNLFNHLLAALQREGGPALIDEKLFQQALGFEKPPAEPAPAASRSNPDPTPTIRAPRPPGIIE